MTHPSPVSFVQYGCGLSAPATWRNFDASPSLRLQRLPLVGFLFRRGAFLRFPANVAYGDILRGLPVEPDSCAAIYCSHVLEHLALADCRVALRNTCRYLMPGGIFRLVMPDLERLIQTYTAASDPQRALHFMHQTGLGSLTRPGGLAGFLRAWLGNSAHLWLWDYRSIEAELHAAGFQRIRRAEYHDSAQPAFLEVEEAKRWEGCLGVECVKAVPG